MPPDPTACVIDPKRSRKEPDLPPLAILLFSPEDLASCLACLSERSKSTHKLYLSEVFTGTYKGAAIALAGPMLGAPQSVLVMERMVALGTRAIIAVGWCGSLQENVRIGDIVLPVAAISEEGTSPHYSGHPPVPSAILVNSLKSAIGVSGLNFHVGAVWTTDAPFRETIAKVRKFQAEGVLSVDMETSALLTVARFRGIELAVVLVVSDDLSSLKWTHGFRDPVFKESRKKLIKSTLTAICTGVTVNEPS